MTQWRSALRLLLRRPGFTLAAVCLLGLGIGANATLFTIVDTILLKPLPYPDADRLSYVYEADPASREKTSLVAPVRLEEWNRLNRAFTAIAGYYNENVTDATGSVPERLAARHVSPRYFTVFGTPPLLGRVFNRAEETDGGPNAVVISYGLWSRRFNRDPRALGSVLRLGGEAYTIVGVMPKQFAPPSQDLWLPAPLGQYLANARDARFWVGIGRLRPGISVEQARGELARVQRGLGEQFPATDKGWSALVMDMKDQTIGDKGRSVWLAFAAVGLLMLLACANIGGLLLGQLHQRERELAIRRSLGATRGAILAMVMREVALIACVGGALGIVASVWSVSLAARLFTTLPRVDELHFDARSVAFTAALSVIAALIAGLAPALQASRQQIAGALAQGGRTQAGGRHAFRNGLLVAQFAITFVLLCAAGLLLRSYQRLTTMDAGFDPHNVLVFHVGAAWGEDRAVIGRLQQEILAGLRNMPGVEAAGMTNFLPTDGATLRYQFVIEGLPATNQLPAGERTVSPGYLQALHIPLLAGATCPQTPDWNLKPQPGRMLVNRKFVDEFGRGQNLIGKQIGLAGTDIHWTSEVAGIVGNVREDSARTPAVPYVYMCAMAGGWPDPDYVVRTRGDVRALAAAVRQLVHNLDPHRAVFGVSTLDDHVGEELQQPRLTAGLLAAFATLALALAAFGLYSVVALSITARKREIGVRMALGARSREVVVDLLAGAGRLLAVGMAAGAALAIALATAMRSVLFGVEPADPLTLAAVFAVLTLVSLCAVALPAWRAASIDPVEALRTE